jgi:hypothetical protein
MGLIVSPVPFIVVLALLEVGLTLFFGYATKVLHDEGDKARTTGTFVITGVMVLILLFSFLCIYSYAGACP